MDFAHAVTCETEWAPIVERIGDLEKRQSQLSRVRQARRTWASGGRVRGRGCLALAAEPPLFRQAWKAVRDTAQESEARKKRGLDESDDTPLPAPQLAQLGDAFHARYKIFFPAECEPSEALISKLSREITRLAARRRRLALSGSEGRLLLTGAS